MLTYLHDSLACPLEAECIAEKKMSLLRKSKKVTVLEFLDDDEYLGGDFFIRIEWVGCNGRPAGAT